MTPDIDKLVEELEPQALRYRELGLAAIYVAPEDLCALLSERTSQRQRIGELEAALNDIEQRANESGTGEMGLLNTIHEMHATARRALSGESK